MAEKKSDCARLNGSPHESIECFDDAGSGLSVEFEREPDRWTHRIFWCGHNRPPRLLLSAIEGNAADRWPLSPPLQELVVDKPLGKPIGAMVADRTIVQARAMLLGRAGSGHWSASFELFADPVRLVIDVACRISTRAEFLGSTYRLDEAAALPVTSPPIIELARESDSAIRLMATLGAIRIDPAGPREVQLLPDKFEPPTTCRWRYELACVTNTLEQAI